MINIVHNCDCMEFMKTCKDNQFELAIVDPPYGIKADKKNSDNTFKSNKSAFIREMINVEKIFIKLKPVLSLCRGDVMGII